MSRVHYQDQKTRQAIYDLEQTIGWNGRLARDPHVVTPEAMMGFIQILEAFSNARRLLDEAEADILKEFREGAETQKQNDQEVRARAEGFASIATDPPREFPTRG